MSKEEIYATLIRIARENQQTVGEKNDYYVTLQQLERVLITLND